MSENECPDCDKQCADCSGVQTTLELLKPLPQTVNRLQGGVSIISILLTVIVTVCVTMYFEGERNERVLTAKVMESNEALATFKESCHEKRAAMVSRLTVVEAQIKFHLESVKNKKRDTPE